MCKHEKKTLTCLVIFGVLAPTVALAQLDFVKKLQDKIDDTVQSESEQSRKDGVTLDPKEKTPSNNQKTVKPKSSEKRGAN